MDIDYALSELGEFGKYQIGIYFLLFFPFVFSSLGTMNYVFTSGDLEYRCKILECETNITSYEKPWLSSAFPYKGGKLDTHCKRYKTIDNVYHENCTENTFLQTQIEECHSFVYKNQENTIIKEFDLLCDENNWKRTIVGTLHNIGEFIGMPLAGIISDKFGRKKMVVTAILTSSVTGTIKSFSVSYIMFLVCEVIDAIAIGGIYAGVFILGVEMTGPSKRAVGGTVMSSYYSMGEMVLGGIAYFVIDWRMLLRVIYIPSFAFVIYYWIMPESIRWLESHGKTEKLIKSLERISSWNNKPMRDEMKAAIQEMKKSEIMKTDQMGNTPSNYKSVSPAKDIFKSRIMLLRVLNCSFCWITNAFVYYGLSLSSVVIGGNKYVNFILVCFVEIPGYIITGLVVDRLGRRRSLGVALAISGLSCTLFHFINADMGTVRLIMFLFGKCAITVSFTTLYIIASEFFPTTMRNSLMGFCSTLGRFGSMIAPQMPLLSVFVDPVLIFGAAAFVAGALSLYFPETLNCNLPDTIAAAEIIGKGQEEKKLKNNSN